MAEAACPVTVFRYAEKAYTNTCVVERIRGEELAEPAVLIITANNHSDTCLRTGDT